MPEVLIVGQREVPKLLPMAECIELIDSQFTEKAVAALRQLHSNGELGGVTHRRKAVAS